MSKKTAFDFFADKFGDTVMVEHVYPLLYQHQDTKLLGDIRSFCRIDDEIEEKYATEHKPVTLYNDLMYFMNNHVIDGTGETTTPNYMRVIYRYHKHKNYTDEDIYRLFLRLNYGGNDTRRIERINRLLLGMMTPQERKYFVNHYS